MEPILGGFFLRARASLGASSFGMQILQMPPSSGEFYPNHDHADTGAEEVYAETPDAFIAAAVFPPMQATEADGGYRVGGRCPLVSNCHEARWFLFVARLHRARRTGARC